ncbi:MAG: N-acetylneuraminate lyase [bacterium]
MKKFKGIFPAIITPFDDDNNINQKVLKKIVRMNIENGVSGFYVGGSTGEVFLLSLQERKEVLETVIEEIGDDNSISVIAHVGCISTDDSIELAKHAEKAGADAVSSLPPFYYNFSFAEIKNHFFTITENVNLPLIIYNFPDFSGIDFDMDNFTELFKNEQIAGVKHTSYNLYQLERFKEIDEDLTIFAGRDEIFLGALTMGADGAIGSTYNFMADKFVEIEKLYNNGEMEKAKKLQKRLNNIIDVVGEVGLIPAIKYILKLQGFDCGKCRKPFKTLNQDDKNKIEEVVERNIES